MEYQKPTVFLGSSKENLDIAEIILMNLSEFAEVTIWEDIFQIGVPTLDSLVRIKDKFDFAIFILTADDYLVSRGREYNATRDNIIFELGLFIGSLGNERVFAICDKNVPTKILSDYSGVTYVTYDLNRSDGNIASALRSSCIRLKQSINDIHSKSTGASAAHDKPNITNMDYSAIGLEKVFSNYEEAEAEILNELKNANGPIRMFLQIAANNIGIKGSLYDLIEQVSNTGIELRILHASEKSPMFAEERLRSMGKDPKRIIPTIKYVNSSLKVLSQKEDSSLRERTHTWPYIWRIYSFDKKLYLMPYFSERDATKSSPVLVFTNSPSSLYSTFVDYFDYLWEQNANPELLMRDIITPSTRAGTALILKWRGYYVFGIAKRDVDSEEEYIRFSGIGGKRIDYHESLTECALREGNEETDNSVGELIQVSDTRLVKNNGSQEMITIIDEQVKPSIIISQQKRFNKENALPDNYYLIVYRAILKKTPKPSNEVAALLFLERRQLASIHNGCSINEILADGARIDIQDGINIDRNKLLKPHGLAEYMINNEKNLEN